MGNLNLPANAVKTSLIRYDKDKSMFAGQVKQGDPLHHIFCVIDSLIGQLFENDLLKCIDIKALGIECQDPNETPACTITKWLTTNMLSANTNITTLLQNLQIIQNSVGMLADEKVKVKAAGTAKYLSDIIKGAASNITFTDNEVNIMGLVPIGTRMTISRSRLADFDATGKGRPDTDLWGWAIRNGQNGLPNHLGMFSMFTDNLLNADTTGGAADFTVKKENIQTFTIPVAGVIGNALNNNVKFKVGWAHCRSFEGEDGGGRPLKIDHAPGPCGDDIEWFTEPANFQHSHSFTLNAQHNKATPDPIALVPLHIKEIPIERIIP